MKAVKRAERAGAAVPHDRAVERPRAVLIIVVSALLAAFAIAPRAWLEHPLFVPIPLRGWPLRVPAPFDAIVLLALVSLLLPLPFMRRPRPLILAWLTLFLVRASWDSACWQPYLIEYACILGALACVKAGDAELGRRPLVVARLVVVAAYFWAGVGKIDAAFLDRVAPAMLAPLERVIGIKLPLWTGALVPAVEIGTALALASRRWRRVGILGALVTHAVILGSIGPLGMNVQHIVWPWNVALPALVVALFHGDRLTRPGDLLRPRRSLSHVIALVLLVAIPAASYVVPIDPYLAHRIYSTKTHEAVIELGDSVVARLPERNRRALEARGTRIRGGIAVRVLDWVSEDLGAYLSPSSTTYRHVARQACRLADDPDDVFLTLFDPPGWVSGRADVHRLRCADLEGSDD